MATEELIEVTVFCTLHRVESDFIHSLSQSGLITLRLLDQREYIPHGQLQQLEKMTTLYQDLDINLAGIEAIVHMLERIQNLNREIGSLKNELLFYKSNKLISTNQKL